MYRKNTASQVIHFGLVSATDGSAVTGATVSVRRCLDGTFGAGGGTVTEDASGAGFYKYAMAQADTNANNVGLFFTATGAIPVVVNFLTTAADPTDSVRLGLTALPNAAADAAGGLPISDAGGLDLDALNTNVSSILDDTGTSGVVLSTANRPRIRKNTALSAFPFLMTDDTNHNPATGLTVSATRSLDGAAFASCTNSVVEVSNGWYTIDLAAGDLNGDTVALRFTATGADDLDITVITNP